jgi:O-antigen/teichoic acid export membrane protein
MRKLFTSTAIYAFAPQLPRLINLFMTPILTVYLTTYDYGINNTLLAYLGAFDGLRGLGLSLIFSNSFFQEPENYHPTWRKLYGFLFFWSIFVGALTIPVVYFALPKQELHSFLLVLFTTVAPMMFINGTIEIGGMYLMLNQKPVQVVSISIITSLIAIGLNYYTIVILKLGYLGFLISGSVSSLFPFTMYLLLMIFKWHLAPSFTFDLAWIKSKLSLSIPTIPHYYSGYLLNMSDRVVLSLLGTTTNDIGLYSFGYSFGTYFSVLGKGLAQAGTPIFLSLYKDHDVNSERKVRNMLLISQTGLLFIGFILSLWSRDIINFMGRSATLKNAYLYMIPSVMAYTYFPIYFGAISKLRFAERTKIFWKISFVAALINVGLNLILIPFFGIMGAGINTFISYMYMGFSGYFTKEFKEINQVNYYEKYWLVAICSALILAFLLCDSNPWTKFWVSNGAGLVALMTFLKFNNLDVGKPMEPVSAFLDS